MRVRLIKDFHFEAAHRLPRVLEGHRCNKIHGHSFKIEVAVEGPVDPQTGWLYDHARISEAMRPLIEKLDHSYLNDIADLENPTIENMAAWFWQRLMPLLPGLDEIIIHETPKARVAYRGK